ncbi:hypothetical protein JOC47_000841 [Halanaerobacter jeridensis]|uniref:Uncharacterized protein n=1 Tax=Halanaerobacter jeridensis TaxID=706427 RepID=A0A938XUW4_9FIRM|nr:hypothetical protein [Halanaerobacter jeridensis]
MYYIVIFFRSCGPGFYFFWVFLKKLLKNAGIIEGI